MHIGTWGVWLCQVSWCLVGTLMPCRCTDALWDLEGVVMPSALVPRWYTDALLEH